MSRKFYRVHESLYIEDALIADYEELRYIESESRPEKIHITTTNWSYLLRLATDPNYKKMHLQANPPTVVSLPYIKDLNTNKRYFKFNFKTLTHIRDVKVSDSTYIDSLQLIKEMPQQEFLLLQADLIFYLWEAVIRRKCDPELIECMRILPFEEDPVFYSGFLDNWRKYMQQKYTNSVGTFDEERFYKDIRDGVIVKKVH